MFKLAQNGNVLLDVGEHVPPSAAFIIEALEKSTFCDCKIEHDSINDFFKNESADKTLVVASKHNAVLNVTISDDKMLAIGELTLAQGGKLLSLEEAKKQLIKAGIVRGYKQVFLEQLLQKQFDNEAGSLVKGILAKGRLPSDGLATKAHNHCRNPKRSLKSTKAKRRWQC